VTINATVQGAAQQGSTSVTVQASDPIGNVFGVTALPSCIGSVPNASCYSLTVSCLGVSDFTAYLKVNNPSGAPAGTVLFGTGTGGSGLYDDPDGGGYDDGEQVVSYLLNQGYNTVQVSFGAPFANPSTPNGWLTGPGGVRRLACRYATIADWVYRNPSTINSANTSAANSAPMCATGNSGGSAAIAYAVYEYNLASEFAMIEPTSGPVMTRIDLGCTPCAQSGTGPVCANSSNVATMCYESADASVIDEAYQDGANQTSPTLCSSSIAGTPAPSGLFLSDSILYLGAQTVNLSNPNMAIQQVFGDDDTSNAVPEGFVWQQYISTAPTPQCLPNVQHDIPSYPAGATQIGTDIAGGCH
jgi:hypothetical protein